MLIFKIQSACVKSKSRNEMVKVLSLILFNYFLVLYDGIEFYFFWKTNLNHLKQKWKEFLYKIQPKTSHHSYYKLIK